VQATLPVTGFAAAIPGPMMTIDSAKAPDPTNAILRNIIFPFPETFPKDVSHNDDYFGNGVPAAG
jgi:hypothetical protein